MRYDWIIWCKNVKHDYHCNEIIMDTIASQITSLTIVYSTVYSDADQRKHQSSTSMAFVRGIHRGPVNSAQKWPVTRKMFPFDDVIMYISTNQNPINSLWPSKASICLSNENNFTRYHSPPLPGANQLIYLTLYRIFYWLHHKFYYFISVQSSCIFQLIKTQSTHCGLVRPAFA